MLSNLCVSIFMLNILLCTLQLIQSRDPLYITISLAFCFINICFLLLLMDFQFIALIYLIVYVGAIVILILFAVMLLNLKDDIVIQEHNSISYLSVIFVILHTLMYLPIFSEGIVNLEVLFYPSSNNLGIKTFLYSTSVEKFENFFLFDSFNEKILSPQYSVEIISEMHALGLVFYTYGFLYLILVAIILLIALIGAVVLITTDSTDKPTN